MYIHILEWQGYRDPTLLWRVIGYKASLLLRREERPILLTVVYVTPEADVGDAAEQDLDGQIVEAMPVHCIRLWEHDASAAVASGRVGLAVISPLLAGADEAVVEGAARVVLTAAIDPGRQRDLLGILAVFAEELVQPGQLERIVGKERLMQSKMVSYLYRAPDEQSAARALAEAGSATS